MNAQMFGETIDTEVSVGYVPTQERGNDKTLTCLMPPTNRNKHNGVLSCETVPIRKSKGTINTL